MQLIIDNLHCFDQQKFKQKSVVNHSLQGHDVLLSYLCVVH